MRQELTAHAEREIAEAFHAYMQVYFLDRDLEKSLEFVSPELLGFGTGRDERMERPGDYLAQYARDMQQSPGPNQFTLHYLNVTALSESVGVALAEFQLDTVIDGQPFHCENVRELLVFRKTGGRWLICRVHVSMPYAGQKAGESYPLTELAARNRVTGNSTRHGSK